MSNYYVMLTVTLVCAALPCITGAIRFKVLETSARMFYFLLLLGFVTELAGHFFAMRYRNNLPVYNISNLAQTFLICLYFNYAIEQLGRRKLGWYLGFLGIALGIADLVFFQPLDSFSVKYFMFQVLLSIVLTGVLFRYKLLSAILEYKVSKSPDFWFSLLLVNFGLFNLFNISFYDYFTDALGDQQYIISLTMVCISGLFNTGFALVFLFYPKMKRHAL